MNEKESLSEFEKTWTTFLEKVSAFEEENFNRKPAENKWSAGQVVRHLIKANSGLPEMLNGENKETERQPDEMVDRIKTDFLNLEMKMDSPDFIVPEDKNFDKNKLFGELEQIKSNVIQTAGKSDLTETSLAFEFPVYGYLTGIELLAFAAYHTQRHLHQLDKITQNIK